MQRIAIAGLTLHDTDVSGLESVRRPDPGRENAFFARPERRVGRFRVGVPGDLQPGGSHLRPRRRRVAGRI